MRYIETVIKVAIDEEGDSPDEVIAFVEHEVSNVVGLVRETLTVGNAHYWSTRHEQV